MFLFCSLFPLSEFRKGIKIKQIMIKINFTQLEITYQYFSFMIFFTGGKKAQETTISIIQLKKLSNNKNSQKVKNVMPIIHDIIDKKPLEKLDTLISFTSFFSLFKLLDI
jgi:hypothetical protein